jgi:hypothetical protein
MRYTVNPQTRPIPPSAACALKANSHFAARQKSSFLLLLLFFFFFSSLILFSSR